MQTPFEFEVVIDEPAVSEDLSNRVFEAGCSDALLWENEHVVHLSFERPAVSLGEAVEAALAQLREAQISVTQVRAPFCFAQAG